MNRNNRKRNKKNKRKLKKVNQNTVVRLTQRGRFAPDTLYCVLRYTDTTRTRSNIGANVLNWRYRSSAYDPDPVLATGAIPGYTELSVFYDYYLVEKMVAHIQLCNQETVGITAFLWPTNYDNGNNTLTAADVLEQSSNVRGHAEMMGSSTSYGIMKRTTSSSVRQMYGSHGFTDLDFAAKTTGNPVDPYFINVAATNNLTNFSFGVGVCVVIDYHLKFFGVRQLET